MPFTSVISVLVVVLVFLSVTSLMDWCKHIELLL